MDRMDLIDRLSSARPPTASELLTYGRDHTQPNYRARYNLACYHSERALRHAPTDPAGFSKELDAAWANLHIALDETPGTGLDAWAAKDPSLKTLRENPTSWPKFYGLVWKTSDAFPLSKMEAIGAAGGRKLAAAGVDAEVLAGAAGGGKAMMDLKEKLPDEENLEAWAKAAELMERIHATPEEVNLLRDVGVRSIQDLRERPERLLIRELSEANAVLKRTDSLDETRVRGWLLLARQPASESPKQ